MMPPVSRYTQGFMSHHYSQVRVNIPEEQGMRLTHIQWHTIKLKEAVFVPVDELTFGGRRPLESERKREKKRLPPTPIIQYGSMK